MELDKTIAKDIKNKYSDFDLGKKEGLNRTDKATKSKMNYRNGRLHEDERFAKTDIVITADGPIQVKDLDLDPGDKIPIFCPWCVHDPAHRTSPDSKNAFIARTDIGQLFIFCEHFSQIHA